jgi:hypothetical protein
MSQSGFIIKATCDGQSNIQTMGLRAGYDELVMDVAEAFDLIPASVTMFSLHNGTKLMVHLGAQGDLDVVLAESMEWGSHVLSLQVSGIAARRSLDGFGALAGVAATLSQIFYLYWMVTESGAGFMRELQLWFIVIFTVLVNLGNYFYLLDDETDKNHPFRLWVRPLGRRLLMVLLAPFTGDVLPLVGCKACGLDAPVRGVTRDGIVKWGVLMMAIQDGFVLWVMQALHTGEEALPLSTGAPLACLLLTSFSLVLNLPRRVSHFVLASCESEFMRKEELADDAKISMYASQKIAFKQPAKSPPKERPKSPAARPPMPLVPNGQRATPPGPPPSGPPSRGAPPTKQTPSQRGGKPTPPPKGGKGGKSMM